MNIAAKLKLNMDYHINHAQNMAIIRAKKEQCKDDLGSEKLLAELCYREIKLRQAK